MDMKQIVYRLQQLWTSHMFGEHIVTRPDDGIIGYRFGRGGPRLYIDPTAADQLALRYSTSGNTADGAIIPTLNKPYPVPRTITTNTTLDITYRMVSVDATGGNVTVTLPPVADITGREYWIKRWDSSGNTATLDGDGAEEIDKVTTQELNLEDEVMHIVCYGTDWRIM